MLSTVLSLAAAGSVLPAGTASILSTAASATTAHRTAPAAARAVAATSGSTRTAVAPTAARSTAATTTTVMIQNYAFSPASVTIAVGDTVTWTNMDTAPHTVTVSSGPVRFTSGNLTTGQSFSYTFTAAGTYAYYCAVHPDMVASVVVTDPNPTPTPTPAPTPMPTPMPGDGCVGLQAAVNAFMQHFYAAHLETSPTQQVTDALNLSQYTRTHTVLVENMLKPLLGGGQSAIDMFMQHLYSAHLETSPTDQVAQALAIDQYAKTHTVLIESMLKPLVGSDLSSC